MLHEEWRKTLEGQRVMARLLLSGFRKRAYEEEDWIKAVYLNELLMRWVRAKTE